MAIGSDNKYPKIIVTEGSAPASPSSGDQKLFIDSSDHHLKRKNSAGAVVDVEASAAGAIYPQRSYAFISEFEVVTGCGGSLGFSLDAGQYFSIYGVQNTPGNGDVVQCSFFLKAGTYTMNVLGFMGSNRGIVDWNLDGTNIVTGQDWYAIGGGVYNTIISTASITVTGSGAHLLKLTINGKNVLSSSYYFALTSVSFIKSAYAQETV